MYKNCKVFVCRKCATSLVYICNIFLDCIVIKQHIFEGNMRALIRWGWAQYICEVITTSFEKSVHWYSIIKQSTLSYFGEIVYSVI